MLGIFVNLHNRHELSLGIYQQVSNRAGGASATRGWQGSYGRSGGVWGWERERRRKTLHNTSTIPANSPQQYNNTPTAATRLPRHAGWQGGRLGEEEVELKEGGGGGERENNGRWFCEKGKNVVQKEAKKKEQSYMWRRIADVWKPEVYRANNDTVQILKSQRNKQKNSYNSFHGAKQPRKTRRHDGNGGTNLLQR